MKPQANKRIEGMPICMNCEAWINPNPSRPEIGSCREIHSKQFQMLTLFSSGCEMFAVDTTEKDGG